jgi:hypothetical protein
MFRTLKTGIQWLIALILSVWLLVCLLLLCNGSITIRRSWLGPFWKSNTWHEATLEFSAITLFLDGNIQLEGVTLYLDKESDPVCTFQSIGATASLFRWWNDQPWLLNLKFVEGEVYVSRPYSPTGKRYSVLQQLHIHVAPDYRNKEYLLEVEGKMEDTTILLTGSLPFDLSKSDAQDNISLTEQFHNYSREWRKIWPWIHGTAKGWIDGILSHNENHQIELQSLIVRADKFSYSDWGSAGAIEAMFTNISLENLQAPATGFIHIRNYAGRLPYLDDTTILSSFTLGLTSLADQSLLIHCILNDIEWHNYKLDTLYSQHHWFPQDNQIDSFVLMQEEEQELQIHYQGWFLPGFDFKGVIYGSGTLDPMMWIEAAGFWKDQLHWQIPPNRVFSRFQVELGSGNKLEQAHFDIIARNFGWEKLPEFYLLRLNGHWQDHHLKIRSLTLKGDGFDISGHASADFSAERFQAYAKGYVAPLPWSPELPGWWERLWEDFVFHQSPPSLEIWASGSWAREHEYRVEANISAENLAFHEVKTDRLSTQLLVQPGFLWLRDMMLSTPQGNAHGGIWRRELVPYDGASHYYFDVQSKIPPHDLAKMIDESVVDILKDFSFSGSTFVHGQGSFYTGKHPFLDYCDFTLFTLTEDPLLVSTFPLQWLSARSYFKEGKVLLKNTTASLTNGLLYGEATWDFTQDPAAFQFTASLDHADLIPFMALWKKKKDTPPTEPKTEEPQYPSVQKTGLLALTMELSGPWKEWEKLKGHGQFKITEGNLQRINLLGFLSAILPITSIEFNEAEGSLQWNDSTITFPDLKMSGPTTSLQASGRYSIEHNDIDFMIKIFYLQQAPLLKILSPIFHPFAHLFEVRLWGNYDSPQWRFNIDPRNIFSSSD